MKSLCSIILLFIGILGAVSAGEVEIELTVPRYYTPLFDDIFVAGSFNSWSTNNQNYKFVKLSNNIYTLSVFLPIGSYEFKFTRGSWSTGETTLTGGFFPNRVINVNTNTKMSVKYAVQQWQDMKIGKNSAVGNTYMLSTIFDYPQFGKTKRMWIYLPSDYNFATSKRYPVVYMHDAQNIFDSLYTFMGQEWSVDEAMEKFSSTGKQSAIVVGIENTNDRMDELTPYANPKYGGGKADLYLDFLVNKVKPFVDANFRTLSDRANTAIAGSSLGGLASFYAGLKYQNVFSKIGVFSPSFWFTDDIYNYAASVGKYYDDTRFYFVCGLRESDSMVSDMVKMTDLLNSKGFLNIKSVVKADGQHSEWFWAQEFPGAYQYLFNF